MLSPQLYPTSCLSSPVSSIVGLYDDPETWYDDVRELSDTLTSPELFTVKSEDYDNDEQVEILKFAIGNFTI